jgi:transposase
MCPDKNVTYVRIVQQGVRRYCSMKYYIGCDAHKKYSVFGGISEMGEVIQEKRVEHDREEFRSFLSTLPPASQIAIEATGNWYWLVDEMEKAGHIPSLAHAAKAKLMMGQINKTDKLDVRGLAVLLRNGTLPAVWIPPGELRDQRELPRMRMALVSIRTKLKNRIHATLAKYGITIDDATDIFGGKGRQLLEEAMRELPQETRHSVEEQLYLLDRVEESITETEKRILKVIKEDHLMQLLDTLPGVGPILAIVIALEVGDVKRFTTAEKLASYAGKVPRVNSSGGKTYYGRVRPDVNRYLKWAYTEAANAIVLQQHKLVDCHVLRLYRRVHKHHGHAKAITAVGRHLAEATYWMLKNDEPYREPKKQLGLSSMG